MKKVLNTFDVCNLACVSTEEAKTARRGYSCVEVIVSLLIISTSIIVWYALSRRVGLVVAVAGVAASVALCMLGARAFYTWAGRLGEHERRDLEERYPNVYRVIAVPPHGPCVIAEGAKVAIGDYGWEAEPINNDGALYLQGLTEEWTVAWYAGFQPDHVELIGKKPRSQYFLPYSWICVGANPPICPFPVLHAPDKSLGFPQRIDFPFVQGVKVDVAGRSE